MEKEDITNIDGLSQEQAYSVVQFAQSMLGGGVFTPQLSNELLLNLNVNPLNANYEKITKALNNAKGSVQELQGYSQWMEMNDMLYNRLIKYYVGLLAWDKREWCVNGSSKDFKSIEFKEDAKRVDKFFAKFKYKKEFERVLMEVMRKGVCYTWLRTNKGSFDDVGIDSDKSPYSRATKYTLQILPQEYCLTTGYFENGMLFDFDLSYFLQPGIELTQYDPFLAKAYKNIMIDGADKGYYPTKTLRKRDGSFAYWTQTSPYAGAYMFKWDNSNFLNIPPLAPLMKTAIMNGEIELLQKDKDIQSAYAILSGELRMLDNQKMGDVKNAFSISPDVLGQFMSLVQSGLKKNVKSVALPLENTRWNQFNDSNGSMSINQNASMVAQGVGASGTLFTTTKNTQFEVENAIYADYAFVEGIYSQFIDFLDFYVNKKTKKYKFAFALDGLNRPFAREAKRDGIQELLTMGLTPSISFIASAYGYTKEELQSSMLEAKATGLFDELLLLQTINTQSSKSEGRPRKRGRTSSNSRDYDNSN